MLQDEKGFLRKEISRPIINQPNRNTFQLFPHISVGPPYSIELVFSLSFSHIFPNILYFTLLLRRHLILLPFFMSNLLSVQKRRRDADLAKQNLADPILLQISYFVFLQISNFVFLSTRVKFWSATTVHSDQPFYLLCPWASKKINYKSIVNISIFLASYYHTIMLIIISSSSSSSHGKLPPPPCTSLLPPVCPKERSSTYIHLFYLVSLYHHRRPHHCHHLMANCPFPLALPRSHPDSARQGVSHTTR